MANHIKTIPGRLVCLDILRGLDMFGLVIFHSILKGFNYWYHPDWYAPIAAQAEHSMWTGLTLRDLLMPLFMFCAGTAIPYSMSKYVAPGGSKSKAYLRIARRFIVLWILGMMCQGNLLSLDPSRFMYFSNTLQAIAVGYAFSAIMFLHTKTKTQIATTAGLLVVYWALLSFVKAGDYGCNFTRDFNLAQWADIRLFGRSYGYHTWSLSSISFCTTVMFGMLSGQLLKSEKSEKRKFWTLVIAGVSMLGCGYLLSLQTPIIKNIWTTSMALVTGGYNVLLLALCYLIADWKGRRWLHWLIPIGANCMLAYLNAHFSLVTCKPFAKSIFFGLEPILGPANYGFFITVMASIIAMLCYDILYKHKIFLKV